MVQRRKIREGSEREEEEKSECDTKESAAAEGFVMTTVKHSHTLCGVKLKRERAFLPATASSLPFSIFP